MKRNKFVWRGIPMDTPRPVRFMLVKHGDVHYAFVDVVLPEQVGQTPEIQTLGGNEIKDWWYAYTDVGIAMLKQLIAVQNESNHDDTWSVISHEFSFTGITLTGYRFNNRAFETLRMIMRGSRNHD